MTTLRHTAIAASAGSGKTYQLAHRYIRLLIDGVAPEHIAALTFSRKAAGEIFDAIVEHLCTACSDATAAAKASRTIERPDTHPDAFRACLRSLFCALPRLRIGTLDSFMVGILRAFPTELGIPLEFQVLDENGADAVALREQVLDHIFDPQTTTPEARQAFLMAFKQATFGVEEKDMERRLHEFVLDYRATYQLLPHADPWGQEDTIWPQGCRWLRTVRDPAGTADTLEGLIDRSGWPDNLQASARRIAASGRHTPTLLWDDKLDKNVVFAQLLAQIERLKAGHGTITYSRHDYDLAPEMARAFERVLTHLLGIELRKTLRRTAGIHGVLHAFEGAYDSALRRHGLMTFADAQYLLTAANRASGGARLSREMDTEGRLYIDYRLDSALDHWLLDEFQDTSDLQWAVLQNLVDEILQDDSGERSFFYVGDVKQAIYGWRGGNPSLFNAVLDRYGDRIHEQPLAVSYRSSPAVIEAVNDVFDDLPGEPLPAETRARWQRIWTTHSCAPHLADRPGFTGLFEPECPPDRKKPNAEDRYRLVAALLRELNPVQRHVSTAILVRRNSTGRELVEVLRKECPDIPVVHEGKASVRESVVVELILALLAIAAHPGDLMAWRHLEMSPLGPWLHETGRTRERLPLELLHELHRRGAEAFLRIWTQRLEACDALDAYARHCLHDLLDVAIRFDRSGGRDPVALYRLMAHHEVPQGAGAHAVRVMTIHQSKGLGFDVVIVPELDGRDITRQSGLDLVMARDPGTGLPRSVVSMPRRVIAEADPTLVGMIHDEDVRGCFENLCLLYVALTRAKRGLYIITSFAGKSAKSYTASEFLKQQLAEPVERPDRIDTVDCTCLYARGDRDWYREHTPAAAKDEPPAAPVELTLSPRPELARLEPSAADDEGKRAAWLFNIESRDVLDFGSGIHACFEQVTWGEDADVDTILNNWQSVASASADVREDVACQFRRAMKAEAVRTALTRPAAEVTLWREKAFQVILDNKLLSGVFDRVVIERLPDGTPARAVIQDYKSDRVSCEQDIDAATERHSPQLALYRRALSHILQLDPEHIALQLIFTAPAVVRDVARTDGELSGLGL